MDVQGRHKMGRHSSDSEEEKKKHKKKKKRLSRARSRSASVESRHSSKHNKSKKRKKHRSRSASSTRSNDRHRTRSRSRDKHRRKSRSNSRGRYSRSRSHSRDRRRRSRSHESHSRSSRRSRSRSPSSKKSKSRRSNRSEEREDPCLNIPGFADMAPSEQAKIRMNMALKAAAAADEKIKGDNSSKSGMSSMKESLAFSQAVQDIESGGFSAGVFKSTRNEKRDDSNSRDEFLFGTAGELRLDGNRKAVIVDVDREELAHPSLYSDPEEKLDKWIHRLTQLRRKKLEGEALY
ncbi:serine/Arginine-related protein 53-like isoform X2 [Dreissena polymorpha]|uniref:serine/Arginine-related protein 53-like isoform X2 n=1 Tax=Dreissena polymorpha TaxID=45954 RepID=UPI00226415D7|nr:serine/Arginine-related protein 53-like isoform X2 [Dreissena polymorpha]